MDTDMMQSVRYVFHTNSIPYRNISISADTPASTDRVPTTALRNIPVTSSRSSRERTAALPEKIESMNIVSVIVASLSGRYPRIAGGSVNSSDASLSALPSTPMKSNAACNETDETSLDFGIANAYRRAGVTATPSRNICGSGATRTTTFGFCRRSVRYSLMNPG